MENVAVRNETTRERTRKMLRMNPDGTMTLDDTAAPDDVFADEIRAARERKMRDEERYRKMAEQVAEWEAELAEALDELADCIAEAEDALLYGIDEADKLELIERGNKAEQRADNAEFCLEACEVELAKMNA